MYWIEIYFENGKTLRKESESLNEVYQVLCRYSINRKNLRVQGIKSGFNDQWTTKVDKTEGIVI